MPKVTLNAKVTFTSNFELSEVEIRALDALVGYGDDEFIKVFYEKLGKAYMRDHEAGLRLFFKSVREQVLPALHDINEAKRGIAEKFAALASRSKA